MDTSASITELPYKGSLTPRKSVWAIVNPQLLNRTPRWVKYYPIAAYITFGVNLVVVFAYLIYLGLILNQRKMYMRYKWVDAYHEMNSYSLLSPFMAFPIVAVMSYHVRNKKNLIDGDFLGILGVVLLVAGISVYDATKLIYLNIDLHYILHSTKLKRDETEKFFQVFNKSSKSEVQNWTHYLQTELRCCGAASSNDWKRLNQAIPWSCFCDSFENSEKCKMQIAKNLAHKQGCTEPFGNFLITIYRGTSVCMLILALAFVFTMIAYIFHWAAMQIDNGAYTLNTDDNHPLSLSNYDPNENVQDNKRQSRINRVRHRSLGQRKDSSVETLELFVISAQKNRRLTDADKLPKDTNAPKQIHQQPQAKQEVPPAVGSAQSQPPIVGSAQSQPPIVGSAQSQPPIVGSVQSQPPIVGSVQSQQPQHPNKLPVVGSNQAQHHLQPPTTGSAQHHPHPPPGNTTDPPPPPPGATKSWFQW